MSENTFRNREVRALANEATAAIRNLQDQGLYDTDRWVGVGDRLHRLHPAAVLALLIYIDELEGQQRAYD